MKRRKTKFALVLVLVLSLTGCLYFYNVNANENREQVAFANVFDACAKRVPQDRNYQMYLDPDNIPCYQKALKAGHDKSSEFLLASLLVKQGQYDEARPLYADIAGSGVFGLLFRQRRTAEARRQLQPGAMEEERVTMMRSDQARHDLQVVTAKDEQEEKDFLKSHATMNGMRITYMSEADKATWLQMRTEHDQEQKELQRIEEQ